MIALFARLSGAILSLMMVSACLGGGGAEKKYVFAGTMQIETKLLLLSYRNTSESGHCIYLHDFEDDTYGPFFRLYDKDGAIVQPILAVSSPVSGGGGAVYAVVPPHSQLTRTFDLNDKFPQDITIKHNIEYTLPVSICNGRVVELFMPDAIYLTQIHREGWIPQDLSNWDARKLLAIEYYRGGDFEWFFADADISMATH